MAQILIRMVDNVHTDFSDPEVDYEKKDKMLYKKGHPVVVVDDEHEWGRKEGPPDFAVIKIPGVSKEKARKYVKHWRNDKGEHHIRREWKLDIDNFPTPAIAKLESEGEIIVKAKNYNGEYDYTWQQLKKHFKNNKHSIEETEDL